MPEQNSDDSLEVEQNRIIRIIIYISPFIPFQNVSNFDLDRMT